MAWSAGWMRVAKAFFIFLSAAGAEVRQDFQRGDRVLARNRNTHWEIGDVTHVNPLKVKVQGSDSSCSWDYVQRINYDPDRLDGLPFSDRNTGVRFVAVRAGHGSPLKSVLRKGADTVVKLTLAELLRRLVLQTGLNRAAGHAPSSPHIRVKRAGASAATAVREARTKLAEELEVEKILPEEGFGLRAAARAALCALVSAAICGTLQRRRTLQVRFLRGQVDRLEQQLEAELGDAIRVDEVDNTWSLEFAFRIFSEQTEGETSQVIKIQCPGIMHRDVTIEMIFNGCIVTIQRQASHGLDATTWTKCFQFKPSEGLFEFKEDQATLEHGFLSLVFRSLTPQRKVFRFPEHFNLAATDTDLCWNYACEHANGNLAKLAASGAIAAGQLEQVGAPACHGMALDEQWASKLAPPLDGEKIKATRAESPATRAATSSTDGSLSKSFHKVHGVSVQCLGQPSSSYLEPTG